MIQVDLHSLQATKIKMLRLPSKIIINYDFEY